MREEERRREKWKCIWRDEGKYEEEGREKKK